MSQPKLPLEIDVLSVKQLLDSGEPLLLRIGEAIAERWWNGSA